MPHRKPAIFSVRIAAVDADAVRARAKALKKSVSQHMADLAVADARGNSANCETCQHKALSEIMVGAVAKVIKGATLFILLAPS